LQETQPVGKNRNLIRSSVILSTFPQLHPISGVLINNAPIMKVLLTLLLWSILLLLCWPLALAILLAWPLLWLLSIPFRVVLTVMEALLAFVKALLFLPARLLGYRNAG